MSLVVLLVLCLLVQTAAFGLSNKFIKSVISSAIISCTIPFVSNSNAVIDCKLDCVKNCVRVAPGSGEYCKTSCTDYCEQPDREDGLSGSISSKNGETGLFGGSIDGTVTRQDDKPPKGVNIIPSSMLKVGKIKAN